jgi:hypothetical protein
MQRKRSSLGRDNGASVLFAFSKHFYELLMKTSLKLYVTKLPPVANAINIFTSVAYGRNLRR